MDERLDRRECDPERQRDKASTDDFSKFYLLVSHSMHGIMEVN